MRSPGRRLGKRNADCQGLPQIPQIVQTVFAKRRGEAETKRLPTVQRELRKTYERQH